MSGPPTNDGGSLNLDWTTSLPRQGDRDERLNEALERVSAALDADQPIDREALLAEYADVVDELAGCLVSLDFVHNIAPQLKDDASKQTLGGKQAGSTIAPLATLGDFRILREIGRGGMGVVYEAQQLSLGRHVALKVHPFAAMLKQQQLQRFQNEARAAATLSHRNIVTVHAVGTDRGVHYYAMELIDGHSIEEVIAELRALRDQNSIQPVANNPVASALSLASQPRSTSDEPLDSSAGSRNSLHSASSVETAKIAQQADSTSSLFSGNGHGRRSTHFRAVARIGIQAAEALDHAHQNGVVHRDVKPGNLLLDGSGHLWVTDFGLARIESDPGLTMTGDLFGTLRYMSPEQVLTKRVVIDHRTDIYSLGLTLYELMLLCPAVTGSDREELFRQIAFAEPKPPRRLNPAIPVELETIVLKAMRKNPDERYATAQQLADDLQRFLDDRPILAKPPTVLERTAKWSRRHLPLVASAVLLLLTVAVASAISAGLIWRANQRTNRAYALSQQNFREAEKQKHAAEDRAAENEAVVDFLINDLLSAASPDKALGRQVTVTEVLANAGAKIDDVFPKHPLLEAAVRQAMGSVYEQLGEYETAHNHFLRALKIRQQELQPGDRKLLKSMQSHAGSLHNLGKFVEARKQFERVVDLQREALGLEDRDTLDSQIGLANVMAEQGELQAAEQLARQVLDSRLQIFGAEHSDVLVTQSNLASLLQKQGRLEESEELFEQVLEAQRRILGPQHPETLVTINNSAVTLGRLGKRDKALRRYEEVYQSGLRVLGAKHPNTAIMLSNLSHELREQWSNQSRARFEELLALNRDRLGPDDPTTIQSMEWLAEIIRETGDLEDAKQRFRAVIEKRRKIQGPDHEDTLDSIRGLLVALSRQEDYAEAEPWLEELLTMVRDKHGSEHPATLVAMQDLASVHQFQGRPEKALKLLPEIVDTANRVLGPQHEVTVRSTAMRASCLVESGMFSQATKDWRQLAKYGGSWGGSEYKPIWQRYANARIDAPLLQHHGNLARRHGCDEEALAAYDAAAAIYARMDKPQGEKGLKVIEVQKASLTAMSPNQNRERYAAVVHQAQRSDRVADPQLLLAQGAALYRMGEYQEAIEVLRRSLKMRFGWIDVGTLQQGGNQHGITRPGSFGFQWRQVELLVNAGENPTMRWSIDGKEIGTLDASRDGRFSPEGRVTLGYLDSYPSIADDPTFIFGLVDNLTVTGDVPYSDDFNTDSSGRYSLIVSSPDTRITFAYDYSRLGIPPAPNTTDGTTLGLKLEANLESPGSQEFVTLHTAEKFSGDYRVRFDAWMNTVGPFPDLVFGTTEFLTAGVGGDGKTANQFARNQFGINGSGGWTAVSGDGGNYVRDYRMYKGDQEQFAYYSAQFVAGVGEGNAVLPKALASALCSQDDSDPYYAGYGLPSFEWFYLAMSHWQLHERQQARQAYQRAVEIMETHDADAELTRLRKEVERMLNDESNTSTTRKRVSPVNAVHTNQRHPT